MSNFTNSGQEQNARVSPCLVITLFSDHSHMVVSFFPLNAINVPY